MDKSRIRQASLMMSALSLFGSSELNYFFSSYEKPEPQEKPCCNCGKMKRHNNSFCSAQCCKKYKQKKK